MAVLRGNCVFAMREMQCPFRSLASTSPLPMCIIQPFPALPLSSSACRGRRGLEVLQACAQLLMREIGTESLASGLEVTVQVRFLANQQLETEMKVC